MIFGFLCLCFRAANALSSVVAIKPGDRVMAILPRIPEFFLMQVACLRTGISVSLDRALKQVITGSAPAKIQIHTVKQRYY